jgi:NADH-quinone oxidoreductase subunit L
MVTSTSLIYLIALPLVGAAILLLAGRRADKWGHLLGTAMSAASFGVGLYQLSQMLARSTEERAITYYRRRHSYPYLLNFIHVTR